MIKPVEQPIIEDTGIFDAEQKYLRQEPNETICYINGKAITRMDSGKLMFSPLPKEDAEFFAFGEQIEAEYLRPAEELSGKELETLYAINELNKDVNPKGVYVVAIEQDGDTVNAIVAHPEHPENSYFRISVPELQKLTPEQISELLAYNEERTLDNPYQLQLDGDTLIAY